MSKEEVKLLGAWFSPFVARVKWALKLKGIQFEYVEEDLTNKTPLLLNSNPIYKKVPVLLHDDKPVLESLVIVEYIDEMWKENPILPQDPYERAMVRFWTKFAEEKCLASIFGAYMSEGDEREKAIEATEEALKILEEELNGKKLFGGDKIGLVDITLGWAAHWLGAIEEAASIKVVDRQKFPRFQAWADHFTAIPAIKETLPAFDELVAFFTNFRQLGYASPSTTTK